jgi:hypothetical protein
MKKFALALAFILTTVSGRADEVSLPFANFGDYNTTLVLVNPTAHAVAVPDFFRPFGVGGSAVTVQPFSTFRYASWPRTGGGVAVLDVPTSLLSYVEIRDPLRQILRVGSVPLLQRGHLLQFQDLLSAEMTCPVNDACGVFDTGFVSFVFIHAPTASAVTVSEYRDGEFLREQEFIIPAGETVIPKVGANTNRVVLSIGIRVGGGFALGDVYAFAFISHQPGGEVTPVAATEIEQ